MKLFIFYLAMLLFCNCRTKKIIVPKQQQTTYQKKEGVAISFGGTPFTIINQKDNTITYFKLGNVSKWKDSVEKSGYSVKCNPRTDIITSDDMSYEVYIRSTFGDTLILQTK